MIFFIMMKENEFKIIFLCGAMSVISTRALLQDFMGKENWMAFIDNHWTPAGVASPVALILLVLALTLTYHMNKDVT